MRSDAKASTAGSNQRRAIKRKPSLLLLCLAACVAALAVVVGSASAAKTHIFKEVFGSSAQPTFTTPRGMAIDQGTGEVYVIDAGSPPSVKRYNANGTASNFSALSSNVIDGAGGADTTPQGSLAFGTANRVQIAIDESGTATDGDIYVAQQAAKLVDVFASSGEYKGQLTESSEGLLGEICGVAVDSAGKLYLGDIAGKIHVYTPAANPPVNGDSSANFATVTAPCQIAAGTGATAGFIFVNRSNGELKKVDSASGEVKYAIGSVTHRTVYVNPASGHLYAPRQTGSNSEVVEYDASGAGSATTVSSVKPGSTIEGIAVRESTGDVYLTRSGQASVQVYGPTVTVPDVVTTAASNNTGTRATMNGTVNPDGVELSECKFEWGRSTSQGGSGPSENTAPCAESNATIGSGTSPVAVHADLNGLVPQGAIYQYRLVAKNAGTPAVTGSQQSFTTPNTVVAQAATGVTPTEATLNGTVNPDTATISGCLFEWGPEKGPFDELQLYPETAPCVPGPGSLTGESPVAVEAGISGLHPGTPYAYRLRATYPTGAVIDPNKGKAAGLVVQPLGPSIDGVWSEDVVRTEATLKALVNPEGKATTYRFEWGKTTAYGNTTPEPEGAAGSGSSVKEVTVHLDELEPNTTYHYRFVATNADAANESVDHSFTTYAPVANNTDCPNQVFRTGFSASLPDCRAFEMVSPVEKGGQDAWAYDEDFGLPSNLTPRINQVSVDGDRLTYGSVFAIGQQEAGQTFSQNLAERGQSGWSYEGLNSPTSAKEPPGEFAFRGTPEYLAFSPDLSTGWVRTINGLPLVPGADENTPNLYRRSLETGAYSLLTDATLNEQGLGWSIEFGGVSEDGSIEVFGLNDKLTPEAAPGVTGYEDRQFYVRHDGELHAIGILPNGETFAGGNQVGARTRAGGGGSDFWGARNRLHNAVSRDGSRIFWTAMSGKIGATSSGPLYVREHAEQGVVAGECTEPSKPCTIAISESVQAGPAQYWTASRSGDKVLFGVPKTNNDYREKLVLFDVDTETPTVIAKDVWGVAGAAEDLSRFYFVSEEALAAGAAAGQHNLYLYDEGSMAFVGPLSESDSEQNPNIGHASATNASTQLHAAQATPDGRELVFVADSTDLAAQVGYDNVDPHLGRPVDEVYRYEVGGGLRCISCKPSGARPHGEELDEVSGNPGNATFPIWTSAWILPYQQAQHERHFLSDDGQRVFFNSFDALVPGDSNGVQDVYQWEAPGKGDCTEASSSYSVRNGGCVSLVSGGTSSEEANFSEATPSGDEVFVRTAASLLPKDPGSYDIYAARVDGGFPQPQTTPECQGDSCQSVPESPRFPSHASAAFRGAGNPAARRDCGGQARRAARLSRQAKRLRRASRRATASRRKRQLHRRSVRFAKRATRLSVGAKRCRRANRRAGR